MLGVAAVRDLPERSAGPQTPLKSKKKRECRGFEWRVRRKAQLEGLPADINWKSRGEREHHQQLEQARIDRLLDEVATLRRATDICSYVSAVREATAREA